MENTAVYKLIRGQQEILGMIQLSIKQQEDLTKLYDECFELQKQHIKTAFRRGDINEMNGIENISSEQYYTETYEK